MALLALLHRWTGGIVGLLLAVIGLSGTILLWEESWVGLPGADDPYRADPAAVGQALTAAMAENPDLSRMTFADDNLGLHQAIYADGGGAYLNQAGAVVDRWDSLWARPELWLFDLHHYFFAGDMGLYVTGTLGVLLLAFSVSGLLLWWRTRKTFRFRLWPARVTKSAIVRHHRDIGAVASPLLIMSALTGTFMVFPKASEAVLSPWTENRPASPAVPTATGNVSAATDWTALMAKAAMTFPGALPRRLTLPDRPGAPLTLRMRQDFEWTPNGRTYVFFDPASAELLGANDPGAGDIAAAITEKYYPVHSGKVGGILWKLLLTFSGLSLTLLGTLASWSFWFVNPVKRGTRKIRQTLTPEPAE